MCVFLELGVVSMEPSEAACLHWGLQAEKYLGPPEILGSLLFPTPLQANPAFSHSSGTSPGVTAAHPGDRTSKSSLGRITGGGVGSGV